MIRTLTILFAFAATAGLVACSGDGGATGAAQDVHDTHAAQGAAATAHPEGGLWPTDEPLRVGMSRIEVAVEQAAAEGQALSPEGGRQLAGVVEENVAYIVKNCKLPPQPDAALHVLIGRMITAASQLKGEGSAEEAVRQLVGVLRDYRGTFDHSSTAPGA